MMPCAVQTFEADDPLAGRNPANAVDGDPGVDELDSGATDSGRVRRAGAGQAFVTVRGDDRSVDEASLARAQSLVGLKGYVTNVPVAVMPAAEVIAKHHDLWLFSAPIASRPSRILERQGRQAIAVAAQRDHHHQRHHADIPAGGP